MATGRTVGASILSDKDKRIFELINKISNYMNDSIKDDSKKKEFIEKYSKISKTRDAGTGQGGGKLQRDALTTRGKQGKVPYSNRNLRWNPLILASKVPTYAKHIEGISIEGEKVIKYKINNIEYYPEQVYNLDGVYASIPEDYSEYVETLKNFTDADWTANSCLIPASEYSPWNYSVQTYVVLGIIILKGIFEIDETSLELLITEIKELLKNQNVDENTNLMDTDFEILLNNTDELIKCPLCKTNISDPPGNIKFNNKRETVFQAPWKHSKRDEGEAESIQLLHMEPLVESEIKHKPSLVRYGHRWCNISMTDHSIDETVDFMTSIVKAHKRC
jgi:hypothetical protein